MLAGATPLMAQFQTPNETQADFIRIINNFTKQFNLFTNMVIDGKWDMKITEDLVKRFEDLTDHPAWLRKKK